MKKLISILLIMILALGLLTGCNAKEESNKNNSSDGSSSDAQTVEVDFAQTDADMFTERDWKDEYDKENAVTIKLNGNSATASSDSVKISDSMITITEEATYIISGELSDGMLVVDAPDTAKLQLVFDGVNITSKTSAAVYILEADKVFITLAEGSTNTLANGGSFVAIDDNAIDAALFSKQDLTMNGTGSLNVVSPAGHGIVCKDDLVFTNGSYVVNSASHGLDANDSVRIAKASITIDAGKDAIHSENSDDTTKGFVYISSGNIHAEAEGDGISAGAYLQIVDGTIDLQVGGGSSTSMKGLKSTNSLLIAGGEITINSADDAIHSNVSIILNGGTFEIASGDDAIHAEEKLTVTAGKINITESYEGLEALHIEVLGGDIKLVASDDGFNAAGGTDQSGTTGGRDGMKGGGRPGGMNGGGPGDMSTNSSGSIIISGGTIYINSSGDGLDANGTLEISGGYTTIVGPTHGDTATLDYDSTGTITGGTFIGTGASGMAQTFSNSEQGVIAVSVGNQSSGTEIVLKDSKGNVVISHTPELDYAVVILSSPELVKGETYTITVGSQSGEFEAE